MFQCPYCSTAFSKEETLLSHFCEKRRRWMYKNDPEHRAGFNAYVAFMESMRRKKISYDSFISSGVYDRFISLGRYMIQQGVDRQDIFVNYMIRRNAEFDEWMKPELFKEYLIHLLRLETVEQGLVRSFKNMNKISDDNGIPLRDVFKKMSTYQFVDMVTSSRLSPWIIYNEFDARNLMASVTPDQATLIYDFIHPTFWLTKLKLNNDMVKQVKNILREAGLCPIEN